MKRVSDRGPEQEDPGEGAAAGREHLVTARDQEREQAERAVEDCPPAVAEGRERELVLAGRHLELDDVGAGIADGDRQLHADPSRTRHSRP